MSRWLMYIIFAMTCCQSDEQTNNKIATGIELDMITEKTTRTLQFRTNDNHLIAVGGQMVKRDTGLIYKNFMILFDTNEIYLREEHTYKIDSKYNQLIQVSGNLYLILEIKGSPKWDRIVVYKIQPDTAFVVAETVYNDKHQNSGHDFESFTDIDKDGYIEFGGFDVHAVPLNSVDYQFYHPSTFYQIANGQIEFDSALTEKMDILENGLYMKHPYEDKEGYHPVTIPKPKYKRKNAP